MNHRTARPDYRKDTDSDSLYHYTKRRATASTHRENVAYSFVLDKACQAFRKEMSKGNHFECDDLRQSVGASLTGPKLLRLILPKTGIT